MDCFIRLLRGIVTDGVELHGMYPVPESSTLYDFSSAFPRVFEQLRSDAGVAWFNRESVRLYWLFKPVGYTEGYFSSDDEGDSGDDSGSELWDDSNSDGGHSCETDLTSLS
jgi:hypothetical protein